jgi:hypothetical protein
MFRFDRTTQDFSLAKIAFAKKIACQSQIKQRKQNRLAKTYLASQRGLYPSPLSQKIIKRTAHISLSNDEHHAMGLILLG